jgi:ketosteroid isomerase-like protein
LSIEDMKETVRLFLNAMGEYDVDTLRSMLTDDARWWVPPSAEGRLERPVVGGDRVANLAGGQLTAAFRPGTTTWDVEHVTAEDDRVSILMQRRSVTAAGKPYLNQYHWLFRFERDRVAEVWEIMDTALAQQQLR